MSYPGMLMLCTPVCYQLNSLNCHWDFHFRVKDNFGAFYWHRQRTRSGRGMGFLLCDPGSGLCPLWDSVPPPGKQPESPSSPSSTLIHEPGRGAPVRAQPGCG